MRTATLRRLVDRAAADVAAIAERDGGDALAPRDIVADFEEMLRGTVANLESAITERGVAPAAPMGDGWAEPTVGALAEFFRAELTALDALDRDDLGTVSLVELWLRSYFRLRDDLGEGTAQTEWPCPTAWLELQLFRLAWQGPERVSDHAEYNRLNGLLWERKDYVDPVL